MALARNAARPTPDLTWRAFEIAALAAQWTGNNELAVLMMKIAIQSVEIMRQGRAEVDPSLASLSLAGPSFVYEHLARLLAQQGRFGEATEAITLRLSRAAEPDQSARYISLTEAEEQSAKELVNALDAQAVSYDPRSLSDNMRKTSAKLDSQLTKNRAQITALNRALHEKIRRRLPDGVLSDTLIVHVISEDNNLTLLAEFDGKQISLSKAEQTLPANEINQLAYNFLLSIRSGNSGERERCGRELYRRLISPLLRSQPPSTRRILMSAPGPLHGLPWAALTDGTTYLIECFDIVRATVPDTDLRRYPRSPMKILACAAHQGGKGFAPLAHVVGEVRALDATCVLDEAGTFTRTRLGHALPSVNILHLASHFSPNPGALTRSTLLLGDGTEITVGDLIRLGLGHLDLVVLSACETGSTAGRQSDQASFAIDHMLLVGRVPAVLATLFKIDDAATAELMRRFYTHLRSGEDKARALAM